MIVLDASAAVDALAGHERVLDRVAGEEVHAPHLIDVEVASALRRLVRMERIPEAAAARRLEILGRADIRRHAHLPLLPLVWSLRDVLGPYDATYVALAAALDALLVTTDRKLAGVPGLPCAVDVP